MKTLQVIFFLSSAAATLAQDTLNIQEHIRRLVAEEKYQEALPLINQLIESRPDYFLYRQDRASIYYNLKKYNAAAQDFVILCREYPESAEFFFQAGNMFDHADSVKRAEFYYSRAIQLDRENYMYYFKRGTFYLKAKAYEKSVRDFTLALEQYPEHDNSLHNRGIAYFKLGQEDKACEDWCQAQLLGNSYSGAHLDRNCKKYPEPCLLQK